MKKSSFPWRGINHLALITNDMDATVRFWHGVMGARLIATIGTEDFRHYFFDIGSGCTVAFFEYASPVSMTTKPAGVHHPDAGGFDHLSLNVDNYADLKALRSRLIDWGCEVTDNVDHGLMMSIYFTDPNGIALEASVWQLDPTAPIDIANFADANPIPVVAEVLAGTLDHAPQTHLVSINASD